MRSLFQGAAMRGRVGMVRLNSSAVAGEKREEGKARRHVEARAGVGMVVSFGGGGVQTSAHHRKVDTQMER